MPPFVWLVFNSLSPAETTDKRTQKLGQSVDFFCKIQNDKGGHLSKKLSQILRLLNLITVSNVKRSWLGNYSTYTTLCPIYRMSSIRKTFET